MKKFFLTLLLIFLFSSESFCAVSQDIYVRQDVFDAKMEALFERLHGEIVEIKNDVRSIRTEVETIKTEIKDIKTEIKGIKTEIAEIKTDMGGMKGDIKALSAQINGVEKNMTSENRALDKRISDLQGNFYLWLVFLGIVLGYEPAKKFFQAREERRKNTPSFTLEDVEKLIDSKLSKLVQS